MDKTQLPQDSALFHTFLAEDYIGSSEGLKMSYSQPKNGQQYHRIFLNVNPILHGV